MDAQSIPVAAVRRTDSGSFFTESEQAFYSRYPWCLNPYPSVQEVMAHLRSEVEYLGTGGEPWQLEELMTNIFLLSCALSDSADDCLGGKPYNFSRKVPRLLRPLAAIPDALLTARHRRVQQRLAPLRRWRGEWEEALHRLLCIYVRPGNVDIAAYTVAATSLVNLLAGEFPVAYSARRINSPRAFRSQDYSSHDIVTLAEKFCAGHAQPGQPCLVVGMRTAGSYFGPLLRACLANRGYRDTGIVTLRPKGGVNTADQELLQYWAARGGQAIIIDEPVYQGGTLASCIQLLHKAGFATAAINALFPVHPSGRDWNRSDAAIAFSGCRILTIESEETFKYACLDNDRMEQGLLPYFAARGWTAARIVNDARARMLNAELARSSDEWFHTRLKRVYAFELQTRSGETETRYVIAKSIGWGWAAYQAFFAARSLASFVPPVLGLRNGILFSEWVGNGPPQTEPGRRNPLVERIADYVAARVAGLRFPVDPSPALGQARLQLGMEMLEDLLYSVYRSSRLTRLKRYWLRQQLMQLVSPAACLLDGKMAVDEWVQTDAGVLKADFEQHGMGRMDFSFTDPAYDLSDGMLAFGLSSHEEALLLERYAASSGDSDIRERLPLYKLMAGLAAMDWSYKFLGHAPLAARHAELNRAYIDAWTFSMVQVARLCAACLPKPVARKAGPVVFCDVDGVIDQHIFKFPTTTPSGIRALSLLLGHGLPVYLNTARSVYDVQEYCAAYGLEGGVAESGGYLWDARTGKGQPLVAAEALTEMDRVRTALERLPGVFVNHFYRYSIKAYTYRGGGTVALPTSMINKVLAETGAGRLAFHHTYSDTTITARDVNKGTGLLAMLQFIGKEGASTIAIGDTGPDLAMFRVASRSYAPAHTPVRALATMLGCQVVAGSYQAGFLEIARHIVHPDGVSCPDCVAPQFPSTGQARLIIDLLGEVEKSRRQRLLGALFDFRSLRAFVRGLS